jgi:hypothetical protein
VTPEIEVCWPTDANADADERLRSEFHRLVYAVVEHGGAVGYLTPPTRAETDGWLAETLDAAGGEPGRWFPPNPAWPAQSIYCRQV